MDSQQSQASQASSAALSCKSESGRLWLDLIDPAPEGYQDGDLEQIEDTVKDYFDYQEDYDVYK